MKWTLSHQTVWLSMCFKYFGIIILHGAIIWVDFKCTLNHNVNKYKFHGLSVSVYANVFYGKTNFVPIQINTFTSLYSFCNCTCTFDNTPSGPSKMLLFGEVFHLQHQNKNIKQGNTFCVYWSGIFFKYKREQDESKWHGMIK